MALLMRIQICLLPNFMILLSIPGQCWKGWHKD